MRERDEEWEELLKPLKETAPSDLQMRRWKGVVRSELERALPAEGKRRAIQLAQLAAALLIGFIFGAVGFHRPAASDPVAAVIAQSSTSNATFEYSRANLD